MPSAPGEYAKNESGQDAWQLVMTNHSFYKLLNSYGWEVVQNEKTFNTGPNSWTQNGLDYRLGLSPFYVGPWGYIRSSLNNRLNALGTAGYLWSKSPRETDKYALAIANWASRDLVTPSQWGNDVERYVGESLRCLTQ